MKICTLYVITDCYNLMTKAISAIEIVAVFVNGIICMIQIPAHGVSEIRDGKDL